MPFFWVTTGLLKEMLLTSGIILIVFFIMDTMLAKREDDPPAAEGEGGIRIEGWHNFFFLLGVIGAVIMSGSWKLSEVVVYSGGNHPVVVPLQNWIKDLIIIGMGVPVAGDDGQAAAQEERLLTGSRSRRWPYLFAGIFMTIIPALAILKAGSAGALSGLTNAVHGPVRYFWATGSLSAFPGQRADVPDVLQRRPWATSARSRPTSPACWAISAPS